jgi:UDP-N-acetylglucosamine 2-epimerase (non-hydrolysing)
MELAAVVLTDSGGIQEETTALGVPCLTLRTSTERPITTTQGTNEVVGVDPRRIAAAWKRIRRGRWRAGRRPALWDGRAAERIVAILTSDLPDPGQTQPVAGGLRRHRRVRPTARLPSTALDPER